MTLTKPHAIRVGHRRLDELDGTRVQRRVVEPPGRPAGHVSDELNELYADVVADELFRSSRSRDKQIDREQHPRKSSQRPGTASSGHSDPKQVDELR